ncbi:50S ribosomal protein L3 [Streptobacillus moniliformis]|nr:50S ribosomal protein L3 [Streptobacillus moniliformis]
MGVFKKAGITAKKFLKEFKVESVEEFALGQELKVDVLEGIEFVDIKESQKVKELLGL